VGIKGNGEILNGEEVMSMGAAELSQKVCTVSIFARMFPEAKLKVVEALKLNGEVVAMTGDGVNDAPALKSAHIGIAMGQRGSEVAKGAADLILMDDDLSHMPEAVALGRRIYENLKKAIQYIISIHIPIILIVLLPLILAWDYINIFSPIHVIFLELIMGPTCSIVFENEPIEPNSMQQPPRNMSQRFFSWKELSISVLQGIIITLACLGLGYWLMEAGESEGKVRTVIFTTLVFSNVFLTLVNRSFYYSVLQTLRYPNKLIPLILGISLLLLAIALTIRPVITVFEFEPIGMDFVIYAFFAAFFGVFWIEIWKTWRRNSFGRGRNTMI
jgi:P-type Ca2+ transporter type 2C